MSSKLKVQELRDELAKRGLETTGLKAALLARLDEAIALEADKDVVSQDGNSQGENGQPPEDEKENGGRAQKRKADATTDAVTNDIVKRIRTGDVNKLTVAELKEFLEALGHPTGGTKAVLKKRLLSALPEDESGDDESEDAEEKQVTATKKGSAVLDLHIPDDIQTSHHVLADSDGPFDAMLNQTNIGGNNNKYYVIQALESDSGTSYILYTRWGRVGAKGQSKVLPCGGKEDAKRQFEGTFRSKTGNEWSARHTFTYKPGKYTWLEMDYDADSKSPGIGEDPQAAEVCEDQKPKPSKESKPSKLNPLLQTLISMICSVSMIDQQMAAIGYDARKLPLGKLSKSTILKGYDVLKRIAAAMEGLAGASQLEQLSSEFYTVIPHDFGFKNIRMLTINTQQILKKKLEMVEALGEIEVASKILQMNEAEIEDPLLHRYEQLKCAIEPLVMDGDEADWIKLYVKNTHAATHSGYAIEVQQLFKVVREGEDSRFHPFAGTNRMLLWHGSRLCNWAGILSQGLRIAPPEAPVTGYMFGKGVYFADMVSKSANYCYPSQRDHNNVGLLLLCEVALGDTRDLTSCDYKADKLPPGKLSTKGLGRTAPDPKGYKVLPDGVVVPMGKPTDMGVSGGQLQYNEFIVYDTAQIRMKYLLMVKFEYSR